MEPAGAKTHVLANSDVGVPVVIKRNASHVSRGVLTVSACVRTATQSSQANY